MQIIDECTGVSPFIIYLAAIVAYPSELRAKGVGLLMGAFGLFAVNLVRTVSLYYIGAAFPDLLDFAHLVMWQSLIIIRGWSRPGRPRTARPSGPSPSK